MLTATKKGKFHKGQRKIVYRTMRLRDVGQLNKDGCDDLISNFAAQIKRDDIEALERLKKYPFYIKKRVR